MININKHNQEILNKLYEDNKDSIIEIKSNNIAVIEKIHREDRRISCIAKQIADEMIENNKDLNKIIIVRKLETKFKGKSYALVSGLKWYYISKALKTHVKCIVIDNIPRSKFNRSIDFIETCKKQPKDNEQYIFYGDLRIPNSMLKENRQPRKEKLENKFESFNENNGVLKAITVRMTDNNKYWLVDGYISYLWLKEQKERWMPVKVIN
ncbi:hypothetical protein [Clostridium beijerinckii]|uniref:hypothetical protein n=1 Tax=Clostridium beijerinckii TaxID=1520 RepID=UPI00156FBF2D|nr:hypothetical protein [Clostridium beijerinckii]NRU52484.1 hypothetical protein [Clostridium beijerinckii]NYC69071.1 hypothetical protein [Clostridium beijerinckii]NYC91685.1 hypothetical protein [Clostridium beijerinckii]